MKKYTLKDVDAEDIEFLLIGIQNSFDFDLKQEEVSEIMNFGDVIKLVENRLQGTELEDCTTQQAFYKLREAISKIYPNKREEIKPNTSLAGLFPWKNRRQKANELSMALGFDPNLFSMNGLSCSLSVIMFVGSIIGTVFHGFFGFGIILSFLYLLLSAKFTRNLSAKTVGELVEEIVSSNYHKCRRKPNTHNPKELFPVLERLFYQNLGLDKNTLTIESKFEWTK